MNVKDANALCKRLRAAVDKLSPWMAKRVYNTAYTKMEEALAKKEKEGDFRVVEEIALVPLAEAIAGI